VYLVLKVIPVLAVQMVLRVHKVLLVQKDLKD
jgi:hypothetical protein